MSIRVNSWVVVVLAITTTAVAVAADAPDPSAGTLVIRRCLVEYERDAMVGSSVFGTLIECRARPGDRVKTGQLLGRLQDSDVRAEIRLRETEANSDVEVRLMTARHAMAAAKAQRTSQLMARNAASREEYTQHKLEAEAAALDIEFAKQRRLVAGIHLDQARALLKTRELISPYDGVVVAVLRRQGEAVGQRDPVFQIVDPDHLRVVARVDVSELNRLRVGRAVRVIPEIPGVELPIEREAFPGRVAFIDTKIDPETRTCLVHVLAENRAGVLRRAWRRGSRSTPIHRPRRGSGSGE